jgi:hypothetical protein
VRSSGITKTAIARDSISCLSHGSGFEKRQRRDKGQLTNGVTGAFTVAAEYDLYDIKERGATLPGPRSLSEKNSGLS